MRATLALLVLLVAGCTGPDTPPGDQGDPPKVYGPVRIVDNGLQPFNGSQSWGKISFVAEGPAVSWMVGFIPSPPGSKAVSLSWVFELGGEERAEDVNVFFLTPAAVLLREGASLPVREAQFLTFRDGAEIDAYETAGGSTSTDLELQGVIFAVGSTTDWVLTASIANQANRGGPQVALPVVSAGNATQFFHGTASGPSGTSAEISTLLDGVLESPGWTHVQGTWETPADTRTESQAVRFPNGFTHDYQGWVAPLFERPVPTIVGSFHNHEGSFSVERTTLGDRPPVLQAVHLGDVARPLPAALQGLGYVDS